MGNPNRLPDEHHETFEGRPNDPRVDSNIDPHRDPRFNTSLNAGAVPPTNLSGATRVLILTLGAVLFILLILAMFWHFQRPSPRSPEGPQSRVTPTLFTAMYVLRA